MYSEHFSISLRDFFVFQQFHVSIVVLISLVLNGSLIQTTIKLLHLADPDESILVAESLLEPMLMKSFKEEVHRMYNRNYYSPIILLMVYFCFCFFFPQSRNLNTQTGLKSIAFYMTCIGIGFIIYQRKS